MPAQVLIVEDEQSAARLIASLCEELGLAVDVTRSGKDAQELLAQAAARAAPYACLVLDLVLAELDGFQVAAALRAQPWGAQLPLVVASGVYKQLPAEFAAKVRPQAFLPKPFEPTAMRAALAKACGVAATQARPEGDLAQRPAAALYVELFKQKATGVLELRRETTVRRIYFQQGLVRFAQSNLKAEAMGQAQVASGLIKQASFDRAVALAKQQGTTLYEALAAARVLTPEQLKVAIKQQTQEVAINALAWLDGAHRFDGQAPEQVAAFPDARLSPVLLILEGAKRLGNPRDARAWLEARVSDRMTRSPELERELYALKAAWPGESVTPLATGGRSIGEVLARVKEPELQLLQALCQSGLLQLSSGKAAPKPHPAAPSGSGEEDRNKIFSPQEHSARRLLFGERDHLKDASHYEVLGVEAQANGEQIKTAYFAAAKRFHSDSFSGLELGSARRVAEELFSRVNDAYSVLSDKDKRSEYDVFVDRKAKGLPTDVGEILRAEAIFQRGETLFKAGKWEDAEAAFREAIALNHAEAEFHAYLGMTRLRNKGRPEEALEHVGKSLELDPRLHSGNVFAAQIYEAMGEVEKAKTLLRRAIDKDPEFAQGKAELNRLRTKPAHQEKKGFFGRLLKK